MRQTLPRQALLDLGGMSEPDTGPQSWQQSHSILRTVPPERGCAPNAAGMERAAPSSAITFVTAEHPRLLSRHGFHLAPAPTLPGLNLEARPLRSLANVALGPWIAPPPHPPGAPTSFGRPALFASSLGFCIAFFNPARADQFRHPWLALCLTELLHFSTQPVCAL